VIVVLALVGGVAGLDGSACDIDTAILTVDAPALELQQFRNGPELALARIHGGPDRPRDKVIVAVPIRFDARLVVHW